MAKARDYLAFVVVWNLLPSDYDDERVAEIEKAINSAISSSADNRFEANKENMVFSFPQDPSVRAVEIPVVVQIRLLGANVFGEERDAMADHIRQQLLSFFNRGDVVVLILNSLPIAFSPREEK